MYPFRLSLRCLRQNSDAEINPQITGVHIKIMAFRIAPLVRGERIVKILSSLVVLFQGVLSLLLFDALPLDGALDSLLVVGIDKYFQAVFPLP